MSGAATSFALAAADSLAFAGLSGDFNPLHVDAVAARRLPFGSTVCHGLHLVLKALDLAAANEGLQLRQVQTLHAVFSAPVLTGQAVTLVSSRQDERWRIAGQRQGRTLFALTLTLGEPLDPPPVRWLEQPHPAAAPEERSFATTLEPASVATGLHGPTLQSLFPALAQQDAAQVVAELAATTDIVGMRCPGLHSVYAELKLARRSTAPVGEAHQLRYALKSADPRFHKLRLALDATVFEGTLDALFRPAPVRQASLAEVIAVAPPLDFAGQHALVVGGSRGLGELTAKLLLAAGAEVTVTYARGRAEAEALVAEASAAGRRCHTLALDLSRPLDAETTHTLANSGFTQLHHFASPLIAKSAGWDVALFDQFCRFYLHGFAELVQALLAKRPAKGVPLPALYPSTVFLDEAPRGFAEYVAAKAAGEALCRQLALEGRVSIHAPRLPRLRTDQNSSLLDEGVRDPLPVMVEVLARIADHG